MTPRLRRLQSDFDRITSAFAGHPRIRVQPVGPPPPERYRVVYDVPGLHLDSEGNLRRVMQHIVDVYLPGSYPREKPYCTTPSSVFHPNFGNYVCIADFWTPGQSLVDVIIQIGDMLQYRIYNTSSPLNAVAAQWAIQNVEHLPLGDIDLFPREPEIRLKGHTRIVDRTTAEEAADHG